MSEPAQISRMKYGLPAAALLTTLTLLLVSLTTVFAAQPAGPLLAQIALRSEADLAQVEAEAVPVYAQTVGADGPYLLAIAPGEKLEALRAQGVKASAIAPATPGARYYLVVPAANQPLAALAERGEILFFDGVQALVRSTSAQAAALASIAFEIAAVSTEPITLHPQFSAEFSQAVEPDPVVSAMIDQVVTPTLTQYEQWLTGEAPVSVGGQPYTIATRHTYSGTPIQKATQFAAEHLAGLGLEVETNQWLDASNPNVIATRPGISNPEDIYIISAHLDDMPAGPIAPGADDNASGSSGVLVAADILSDFDFGCTLKFALWTGEEQGLLGSKAWATDAANQGLHILGVLNLDMIAYDGAAPPIVDLHARSWLPDSVAMANLFAEVVDAYNFNLLPEVLVDNWLGGYSDNKSFWDRGVAAILAIEDYDDFTPYYHTAQDRLSTLNQAYFAEFVKASIATFVHMSGCLVHAPSGTLDGHVLGADSGPGGGTTPLPGALVTIQANAGRTYTATTNGDGYYTHTIPTGLYSVTASADGFHPATAAGVRVFTGTVTTQDFVLEPEPTAVPTAVVEPHSLQAVLLPGGAITHTLWLTNNAWGDLSFAIQEFHRTAAGLEVDMPWLSEAPNGGTLAPGQALPIAVGFDAQGLAPGLYLGLLDLAMDDLMTLHLGVPITLTVESPCVAVQGVHLSAEPAIPAAGQVVAFSGAASGSPPITFTWDFGDGRVGAGQTVSHTFAAAGSYAVILTAANCGPAPAQATQIITVTGGCPPGACPHIYLPLVLRGS